MKWPLPWCWNALSIVYDKYESKVIEPIAVKPNGESALFLVVQDNCVSPVLPVLSVVRSGLQRIRMHPLYRASQCAAAAALLCARHRFTTSSCRGAATRRCSHWNQGIRHRAPQTQNRGVSLAERKTTYRRPQRTSEAFSNAAATRSLSLSCLLT